MGFIEEDDFTSAYAEQLGYRKADNFILLEADSQVASLIPEDFGKNLQPEFVTPAVIYLASENAPNGVIMAAGAGVFSRIFIHETMGISLGMGEDMTPENIQANWDKISDMKDARALQNGGAQTLKFFELINK